MATVYAILDNTRVTIVDMTRQWLIIITTADIGPTMPVHILVKTTVDTGYIILMVDN